MSVHLTAPVRVALSTSTNRSTLLPPGNYKISSDVDCTFLQGGSAVTAATTSRPCWAKTYLPLRVSSSADGYVAGIVATGTGTLYIMDVPEP